MSTPIRERPLKDRADFYLQVAKALVSSRPDEQILALARARDEHSINSDDIEALVILVEAARAIVEKHVLSIPINPKMSRNPWEDRIAQDFYYRCSNYDRQHLSDNDSHIIQLRHNYPILLRDLECHAREGHFTTPSDPSCSP